MDEFTFYTPDDGWIESNIRNYTEKSQSSTASERLGDGHQQRMSLALYNSKSPPEYPYTHAYSAYSAVVQLYARSGQLPTADVLYSRWKLDDPQCRHGCDAIEDQHHLFVKCKRYAGWRTSATEEVHTRTENKLIEKGIKEADRVDLLAIAKSLFSDNATIWPLHYCTYFLGHIPKFDHALPKTLDSVTLTQTRLGHHFACDWHTACIRLAGRIWGDMQREMARKTGAHGRRK
jgi:hypothetical protein